jgi:uncharacterized protein
VKWILSPFLAGALFAIGLAVSGMTNPHKVIGFLDLTGRRGPWDPSLAMVMVGAIAVYASAYWLSRRMLQKPMAAARFAIFHREDVDSRLLIGSAIFGIGWGLAGYCPGPALVSLATGGAQVIAFCAAMGAGFWVTKKLDARLG